jgi:1,5-anhydro-D-fructose reductase (1,5-anhydro-D-mannitol-forming)
MPIRWALVSTGKHADTFVAPAIRAAEDAQLVAVCSREHGQAEAFAARHGAAVAYTALEALVQDTRVDVVYIAAPNFLHAPYTTMAAQAGKHVLVEKPMAVGVDDAVTMVRTCQSHGVQLGVGFHLRHHPGHQEARRLIAEGALGTVTLAQAQWGTGLRGHAAIPFEVFMEARSGPQSAWWGHPAQVGGAWAMMAMGVHCVDLLCFLLGQNVVEVTALTDGQTHECPLERLATLCLRFQGGSLGMVSCGSRLPDAKNDATVYGSHGRIVLSDSLRTTQQGTLEVVSETANTAVGYTQDTLALYTRQIEAFHQAIQQHAEPIASGLDGLRAVQVTVAMVESASTGRAVKIAPLSVE